jgi:hypothetical protein
MKRILVAAFVLLVTVVPLVAHHALASEYDSQQKITVKGKLVEIDWRNPHPHFYIEVDGPNGQVTRWNIASATQNMLVRFPGGWTRTKVFARLNDIVSISCWKARDGSNGAYADILTFSDGKTMQMGIGLGAGGGN